MAIITQEQMLELLDKCYVQAVNGIPGSKSCEMLAAEYLEKYEDPKKAP